MPLLALETTTDVCSVALWQAEAVPVLLTLDRRRAHAENLVLLVQDALRYGNVAQAAVEAIAVSQGPGSYTGLRIGVSTAKGLAVAWDAALVGVPTLEALARQALPFAEPGDVLIPAFNARRDEVYAAAFSATPEGTLQPRQAPAALPLAEAAAWRPAPSGVGATWLLGEGATALAETWPAPETRRLRILPGLRPTARTVAELGAARLAIGMTENVAAFEPFYLKPFIAKKREKTIFERLPF